VAQPGSQRLRWQSATENKQKNPADREQLHSSWERLQGNQKLQMTCNGSKENVIYYEHRFSRKNNQNKVSMLRYVDLIVF
jgi:hypothetical protein